VKELKAERTVVTYISEKSKRETLKGKANREERERKK
jgi:hypothetical protein